MSAAAQKISGEIAQNGPIFSYAQAAKGRSPPMPPSPPSAAALSEHTVTPSKTNMRNDATSSPPDVEKDISVSNDIVNGPRNGREIPNGPERKLISKAEADGTTNSIPFSAPQQSALQSQNVVSTPSSPGYGTASTSTLPKDDDVFSPQNGSSDSTSDKHSQTSQIAEKTGEKLEDDKQRSKSVPWDEDMSEPAPLKDAPPPAVNFWQQRKEAQEAKLKEKKPATLFSNRPANSNGVSGQGTGTYRGTEISKEALKSDNKKKGKMGASSVSAFRDTKILGDNNGKVGAADVSSKGRIDQNSEFKNNPSDVVGPPPPEDPTSWPTPDLALQEKKKAPDRAEKAEKDKDQSTKHHAKEKWMSVPYVPSAVFNTQLPARRGGRPIRGGRESLARGGSASHSNTNEDRPSHGSTASPAMPPITQGNDRSRVDAVPRNSSNLPKPKRAASAGPPTAREQRKVNDTNLAQEKRKDAELGAQGGFQQDSVPSIPDRKSSTFTQTETSQTLRQKTAQMSGESQQAARKSSFPRSDRQQMQLSDTHNHPRATGSERRIEGSGKTQDYWRDSAGPYAARERGEGKSDRGRGGNRGNRGSNNGYGSAYVSNAHQLTNGQLPQHTSSIPYTPAKSHSFNERHGSQYTHPQQSQRQYRGNPRSQSIPDAAAYQRYNVRSPPGPPHLPHLQTDLANQQYDYQVGQHGIMSAIPYGPYLEQVALTGMVSMQMEYYFSVDNLCKDMFLRKHMDSQGFVFLRILTNFNRIKQLTQDIELIRYVCHMSPNIDLRMGSDGVDRVRKREGWQQWVLAVEERDASAQNDGPSQVQHPHLSQPQSADEFYSFQSRSATSPREPFTTGSTHISENSYRSLDGFIPAHIPMTSSMMTNDIMDGAQVIQTPLSAAVPDFAPGMPSFNRHEHSQPGPPSQAENVFSDEQVESLWLVVRKEANPQAPLQAPFHSAASRTFSNGSIDGRTIADEVLKPDDHLQSRPFTNGDTALDHSDNNLQRSISPFAISPPPRHSNTNPPPVFWIKNKDAPIDSLPADLVHESYKMLRWNALQKREYHMSGNCHVDMEVLYQFWSHFLIRNFNAQMYNEFRRFAIEDATERDSDTGMTNLIQYYDESILSQKIVSDEVARDYLGLVRNESSGKERPAFNKLRAAWRNGALNMKNRKKVDNILDPKLKAELEN